MEEGIINTENNAPTTDVAVSGTENPGGIEIVNGTATLDGNLKVNGYVEAQSIRGPFKGLFSTLDVLKLAYPSPSAGWSALVGATLPATLYHVVNDEWVTDNEQGTFNAETQQFSARLDAVEQSVADKSVVESISARVDAVERSITDNAVIENISSRVNALENSDAHDKTDKLWNMLSTSLSGLSTINYATIQNTESGIRCDFLNKFIKEGKISGYSPSLFIPYVDWINSSSAANKESFGLVKAGDWGKIRSAITGAGITPSGYMMFSRFSGDPAYIAPASSTTDGVLTKNQFNTWNSDIATLKSNVSTLTTDTATLKTDTATLKTDTATLKTDTATLKTNVASLTQSVNTLNQTATTLTQTANTLSQTDTTLTESINALTQRVNTLAQAVEAMQDQRLNQLNVTTTRDTMTIGAVVDVTDAAPASVEPAPDTATAGE